MGVLGAAPGAADDGAELPAAPESLDQPLPEAVRARVVALAADGLAALPDEDVPGPLRPFKRFTPGRRGRLGATPIAAALERDPAFRQRIGDRVRDGLPDLAAALDRGAAPSAADPLDVAAAAFLLRPAGWVRLVTAAGEAVQRSEAVSEGAQAAEAARRLGEQLAAVRAQARADLERLRGELDATRAEAADLRRRLREAQDVARRAQAQAGQAGAAAEQERSRATAGLARADAEQRRLRSRLVAAEAALETARRSARDGRALADARARLLLDTVIESAQGLRRELALPAPEVRPGDLVDAVVPEPPGVADVPVRARDAEHPELLDQLVLLPGVHVVVDGYNVTKSGYGALPLEAQRQRLTTGLASLAAQSSAEVTCCFDGAEVGPVPTATPRGVRVLFSRAGESADELIGRLVRAEPPGRPVVVVSSDREVADGASRAGARAVPAVALLRRLDRS